ncbi:hypothetical protein PXH67_43400 (plasmid) [Streptomyces sp. P8-A8]|uniref:hypothetical protein n=1 Tax=Streptomyces sp. P8-A8 TaxID=3029759 RepID=UPI0036DCB676
MAATKALPIELYLYNAEEAKMKNEALVELIRICMSRFDLKYSGPAEGQQEIIFSNRRYGVTDIAEAREFGYRPAVAQALRPQPEIPADPEYQRIMVGQNPRGELAGEESINLTKSGRRIPYRGCIGESRRNLRDPEKDGIGNSEVAHQIDISGWKQSMRDTEVRNAFTSWSKCMKVSGYNYPDPMAAVDDPRWRREEVASAAEKAVAVADIRCKEKSNVADIWRTADAKRQRVMMAENFDKLQAEKSLMEMQMRLISRVVKRAQ